MHCVVSFGKAEEDSKKGCLGVAILIMLSPVVFLIVGYFLLS